MAETYQITITGCKGQLPICPIDEHLDIADFMMFGDVEITECTTGELLARCPEHDVVIMAETKGIPLCYEAARRGCRRYVVTRKNVKAYMRNCIHVEVKSTTIDRVQDLYLSEDDYKNLAGKRIPIIDDVVSTGESLTAIERLIREFGGNAIGRACVLVEGDTTKCDGIIFLESPPLFLK